MKEVAVVLLYQNHSHLHIQSIISASLAFAFVFVQETPLCDVVHFYQSSFHLDSIAQPLMMTLGYPSSFLDSIFCL